MKPAYILIERNKTIVDFCKEKDFYDWDDAKSMAKTEPEYKIVKVNSFDEFKKLMKSCLFADWWGVSQFRKSICYYEPWKKEWDKTRD